MSPSVLWPTCMCLLLVRALLAAAQSALTGISEIRAKALAVSQPVSGARLLQHKTDRETASASLRMGMVLTGFLAAGFGALAPEGVLESFDMRFAPVWHVVFPILGALIAGIAASLLEIIARTMANASPEIWALRLSGVVSFTVSLFYPLVKILTPLLQLLVSPWGGRIRFDSPPPPLEELEQLLAAQAANHQVDAGAPALIHSIFELSDKRSRDVMVPRTEVVTIDITTPIPELLRVLAEESHSRIPVFREDVDHIVGILHARDLIPLLQHPELIVLSDIIRPAQFVPWLKSIGDLLREMQRKKIHMSVVVDEYGGFMGVVTLEDILREIVGDLGDEFDEEVKEIEKQADGTLLVASSVDAVEFATSCGLALPPGEYETLGGLLSSLVGSIPEIGERITYQGWHFVVQSKNNAKIDRIRVIKPKSKISPVIA